MNILINTIDYAEKAFKKSEEVIGLRTGLSDFDKNNTYLLIPLIGAENNYEYDKEVVFPNNKIIDPEK